MLIMDDVILHQLTNGNIIDISKLATIKEKNEQNTACFRLLNLPHFIP